MEKERKETQEPIEKEVPESELEKLSGGTHGLPAARGKNELGGGIEEIRRD